MERLGIKTRKNCNSGEHNGSGDNNARCGRFPVAKRNDDRDQDAIRLGHESRGGRIGVAETIHLQKDSPTRPEPEADPLPDFGPGELSHNGRLEEKKNYSSGAKSDESGEPRVEPTAAPGNELGLKNARRFDEGEAQRPENGGEREHSHRLEMELLFPGH